MKNPTFPLSLVSFLLLTLTVALFSCKPAGPKEPVSLPAEVQGQYDLVMEIHDAVMPKMTDIHQLKKQLKNAPLDSIQIAELTGELTVGEDAMWDWMHQFIAADSLVQLDWSTDSLMNYLKKEEIRISAVRDAMLGSIKNASQQLAD